MALNPTPKAPKSEMAQVAEKAWQEKVGIPDYHGAFSRALSYLQHAMDRAVIEREAARPNTPHRSYESGQAEAFAMAFYFVHDAYRRLSHPDIEFDEG